MSGNDSVEARKATGNEAVELQSQAKILLKRWQYLLKLWWDIELVIVNKTAPGLGAVDASIHPLGEKKARLELFLEDRHPYVLEKHIVHELLHLPNLELEENILKNLPDESKTQISETALISGHMAWDEAMVMCWAETLVSLAHGFYPSFGAPPEDDEFFKQRLPIDLRIWRDSKTGEYKSQCLPFPLSQLPQVLGDHPLAGLL